MSKKSLCFVVATGAILIFQSCASQGPVKSKNEACLEEFNQIQKWMDEQSYSKARQSLTGFVDSCTSSPKIEDAQYYLAEALFADEEWLEARGEYNIYMDQFPNTDRTPLANYKKGLASYKLPYREGRDGSATSQGIRDFKDFLASYPNHVKKDSAQYYLNEMIDRQATEEVHIGQLYLRMGEPQATVIHLKTFAFQFANSKLLPKSYELLAEAYTRLDQFEQAQAEIQLLSASSLPDNEKASVVKDLNGALEKQKKKFAEELSREQAKKKKLVEENEK